MVVLIKAIIFNRLLFYKKPPSFKLIGVFISLSLDYEHRRETKASRDRNIII